MSSTASPPRSNPLPPWAALMRERVRSRVGGGACHPVRIDGYEIERVLGSGGMGIVYAARSADHLSAGEVVALKMLRGSVADPQRLQREFRAVADLSHPNLVALYELRADGPSPYFTMELVEGLPLTEYLWKAEGECHVLDGRDRRDPSPQFIARLQACVLQLCDALGYLHGSGRVHGDIKPHNCLVTPAGRVLLLDFGLSRGGDDASSGAEVGTIAGTPGYMAPELFEGEPPSPAADLYALGALLHHVLSGEVPFEGRGLATLMRDKALGAPAWRLADAAWSPDCSVLLQLRSALLAADPRARPTIPQVVEALTPAAGRVPSASARPRPSPESAFPFVGRQLELDLLQEVAARARTGRCCVVVEGRSGIGKSALVQRFITHHADAGLLALRSRCYERETVPYQAFEGIMAQLAAHLRALPGDALAAALPVQTHVLAQLFPALRAFVADDAAPGQGADPTSDAVSRRNEAARALFTLVDNVAQHRPLLLWIDDLQWADRDSAKLLRWWFEQPPTSPCMLVCSFRSEAWANGRVLQEVFPGGAEGAELAGHIVLEPLPEGDAELLRRAIDSDPSRLPMELAVHVLDSPDALEAALDEHLGALSHGARGLLDAIAVSGGPLTTRFGLEVCAAAAARPALGELRSSRLIRSDGPTLDDTVEIFHDRLRDALCRRLSPDARRLLHLRLAHVLLDGGADDESLYFHFGRARDDVHALHHGERAVDQAAAALAFERASALAAELVELAHEPSLLRRLQRKQGDMLQAAGYGKRAAAAYLAAAEGEPARQVALDLRLLAAKELLYTGHLPEAEELFARLYEDIGVYFPRTPYGGFAALMLSRARIAWLRPRVRIRPAAEIPADAALRMRAGWASAQGMYMVDVMRGAKLASDVYEDALRSGDAYNLSPSYAVEALNLALRGTRHRDQVEALQRLARETAVHVDDPYIPMWNELMGAAAAIALGDFAQGVVRCQAVEREIVERHVGRWAELSMCRNLLVDSMALMGKLALARARVPGFIEDAQARGHVYDSVMMRGATSVLALADDRPEDAEAELAVIERDWPGKGYQLAHHRRAFGRIWCLLYRGEGPSALAEVERLWPRFRRSLWGSVAGEQKLVWTARGFAAVAAYRSDGSRSALRIAKRARRALCSMNYLTASETGLSIDAALLELSGERARAADQYAAAAQGLGYALRPLQTAGLRLRVAALRGDSDSAALAAQAHRVLDDEGVANHAAFVRLMAP